MAGLVRLVPATPLREAPACLVIGVAATSPAMTPVNLSVSTDDVSIPLLPEIFLQRGRLVFEQRADHLGRALAGGEHDAARQVEGRVFGVVAGHRLEGLFGLAEHDP